LSKTMNSLPLLPDFRYIVGKNAALALESRRNMSDREFQNLIKKQINL